MFRFQVDSAVDLQQVVDRCPDHMTGADLYALCSDAMTAAIKRKIVLIEDGRKTRPLRADEVLEYLAGGCTGSHLGEELNPLKWLQIRRKFLTRVSLSGLDSEDTPVLVSVEDFSSALENFKPSVSHKELLRYKNIQHKLTAK